MVSIQIDEVTAEVLQPEAERQGLSVAVYLRNHFVQRAANATLPTWPEFKQAFDLLSTDSSNSATEFSRADIYIDHD